MLRPRLCHVFAVAAIAAGCGDNLHRTTPSGDATADSGSNVAVDAPVVPPDACVARTGPTLKSVVTGDLQLDATQNLNTVAFTPPFDRTILFTSLRENEPSPSRGGVQCDLHDVDVPDSLPAGITCRRTTAGTDSPDSTGAITVRYTLVTFTDGVTVQRGIANTGFTNPSTIALAAMDPASTFVLLNGISSGGTGWGNNEFVRAQLIDNATLDIRTSVPGTSVSWQVVSMTGASVKRGTTSLASIDTDGSVSVGPVQSENVVLASYTTDNATGLAAATMMLQATSSGSSIALHRAAGGSVLDVSWELIALPFASHRGTTSFTTAQTSIDEAIAGLAVDNSVVLASNQAILGQSSGSTTYAGADVDLVGEGVASLTTSAGKVTIERSTSLATASISWTAIDFGHDECSAL